MALAHTPDNQDCNYKERENHAENICFFIIIIFRRISSKSFCLLTEWYETFFAWILFSAMSIISYAPPKLKILKFTSFQVIFQWAKNHYEMYMTLLLLKSFIKLFFSHQLFLNYWLCSHCCIQARREREKKTIFFDRNIRLVCK